MANTSDAAKSDGFMKSCVKILEFRLPTCRPTPDFKGALKSSSTTEEAQNLLEGLTQLRLDMIQTLYNNSTYDAKIDSVNKYIAQLFRLYDGLISTEKLVLDKELVFEWRGAITDKGDCFKSHDILFEIMMVLQTKAILHNNAAKALVDVDPLAFLTDAGKHLLEASGIMMTMTANIQSGAWGNRLFRKGYPNPPEVSEYVCNCLALLFKGHAQAMSVTKAITTGAASTPSSIKTKIAVGVINTMQAAFDCLINTSHDAPILYGPILTHVTAQRVFFTVVAYQCAAQMYMEKTEVGNAIAYCFQAKARLVETKSTSKPLWVAGGLPKFVGSNAEYGQAAIYLTEKINQIQSDCERDNKFVYFQQVPGNIGSNSSSSLPLPELPAEASVMNPVAWKEPDRSAQPTVQFTYVPKPSIFTTMFSGLGLGTSKRGDELASPPEGANSTSNSGGAPAEGTVDPAVAPSAPPAGPAPSAPAGPTGPMSDSQYAAELQRKYDAERNAAAMSRQSSQSSSGQPPTSRYNSLV